MAATRKLRILLIVPNLYMGIGQMARYLADAGVDIDFYIFSQSDIQTNEDEFIRLASLVDVVHWLSNIADVASAVRFDVYNLPVPSVATIHHIEPGEQYKVIFASRCDLIQVVSQEWVETISSQANAPVFLAHQVIDPVRFCVNRSVCRPRRPLRIGAFGYGKEIGGRKRWDVLLDGLTILMQRNYEFELIVQGLYWSKLEEEIAQRGIKVTNLGYMPSFLASNSYRHIDLYVCTSDLEGGPLPVLEALASGVPVISTRVGLATEALSRGGGILIDKGNPQALAASIAGVIDDPTLYHRLASETVPSAEHFFWEAIGPEYQAMYEFALRMQGSSSRRANTPIGNPRCHNIKQKIRGLHRESIRFRATFMNPQFWKVVLGIWR